MKGHGFSTFTLGAILGSAAALGLAAIDPGMRRAMRCKAVKASRKAMRVAGTYFR
ncbi:MAG: hypothetical protein ACOYI5_06830 [Christensenellales bacterium]|jgi:hypothetical protein